MRFASMDNSSNLIRDRFAFWFVFSLILNGYASGIPGISLGSVVYIVMIIDALARSISRGKLYADITTIRYGAIVSFTSLVGFCVLCVFESQLPVQYSSIIVGFAKFWLWVLMSSVVVVEFYDFECLLKWLYRFAIILTIYLIIQNAAFYLRGIYLPNIFRFGPIQPYAEDYADYERLAAGRILRAGSLLSESSFYGNFIICTVTLYLEKYVSELKGKRLYILIFFAIGVVLSGSTSAIIILGVIFLLYFRRTNPSMKWQILILGFIAILAIVVAWPELGGSSIGNSLEYSFAKFGYLNSSTRFGRSYAYITSIPRESLVFGTGIGNDTSLLSFITGSKTVYLNSVTSLIIQTGYIGCILFLVLIGRIFVFSKKQANLASACLVLAYFIKGFASGIYFSTYGVLFMFIIIGQIRAERD